MARTVWSRRPGPPTARKPLRVPGFVSHFFLRGASANVIRNAEAVVDTRGLVVSGLTDRAETLGNFFQLVRLPRVFLAGDFNRWQCFKKFT